MPIAAEEPICETLRAVRDDRRVRGVVLNVSSRGGSALASDRILRDVKRLAEKKPVIAYLGDVAASGGYMVAVGAHAIVAQPTTITGSIGVVAARLHGSALLNKLGIAVEVVKRGAHADMQNPARFLEPEEKAHLERQIDEVYVSFLEAVAKGRNKSVAEIEPLAGGRVWSGHDAKRHGLVDLLGGFDVALGELRKRLGPGAEALEPIVRGPRRLQRPALIGRLLPRGSWTELLPLMLEQPRARAWLWCQVAPAPDG
jgi:protease-4